MRRAVALVLLVVCAAGVRAQPARVRCGPSGAPCGPAVVSTGTVPVLIPAAGAADKNCPATVPARTNNTGGFTSTANLAQTCATPAPATVTSVTVWVAFSPAGSKLKCTIYGPAAPTADKTRVAPGCDTVVATLPANPGAFITLATTGSCVLAAATRYWIACTANDALFNAGSENAACTNCLVSAPLTGTFTDPWPTTLTGAGAANDFTLAYYLTATR